jgi:hypothetical protein
MDVGARKLLGVSRAAEWGIYTKFGAAGIIIAKEAESYRQKGAGEIATRWIETDENEKLRAPIRPLPPKFESRLVARGDLRLCYGRTNSPTVDDEGIFWIVVFAGVRR